MPRASDRGWQVGFDRNDADDEADARTTIVRASDRGRRVGFDRNDAMTQMTTPMTPMTPMTE